MAEDTNARAAVAQSWRFFRLKAPHRLPYSTHCMPLQSFGQDQGMHTDGVNIFGRFNVPSSNNATDGMTRKDGPTLTDSC